MSLMAKLTQSWTNDVDAVRDAIIDNICDLISSRSPIWPTLESSDELADTIAYSGLRNMTRAQSKSNSDVIIVDITHLIRCYEPRLIDVLIEVEEQEKSKNQLQFRISATMLSDQGEEAIVLNSFLDLSRNILDVRKSNFV
ncbi:GPW/gp25 family protein [Aliivibrio salmonicida]|uniref:GPW/gp25 family protein n=1 Tax=Aliivibrio salmonicida TaxID=40269 RepID=UPI003D0973C3